MRDSSSHKSGLRMTAAGWWVQNESGSLTLRMSAGKSYYVYIMASASRALYTGVTNNIQRRVLEHRARKVPGFSARYKLQELVYYEVFRDIRVAIAREKQIKGWLRARKIALIESLNPQRKDLSAEWSKPRRDSSLRSE